MERSKVAYDIITRGGKTKLPQYIPKIDSKILSVLKSFDLVHEAARGSGELRKYFAYLTDKGKGIGRELIIDRITRHLHDLTSLIREFGKLSSVFVVGTADKVGREALLRLRTAETLEVKSPVDYLQLYAERRVREEIVQREIVRMGLKVDLGAIGRSGDFESVHPLISAFCHFLVYYRYDDSLRFFRKLENMGLATRVPVYGSKGQYIGEEIRAPIEVAEFLLSKSRAAIDEETLLEFGALMTIYSVGKIGDARIARERFEEFVKLCGVPTETVERVLGELNSLGLTSRYVRLPGFAPFLVLDRGFEEEVERRIYDVAERFLGA